MNFAVVYELYANPEVEKFDTVDEAAEFIRSNLNDSNYGDFSLFAEIPFSVALVVDLN